MDRPQEAQDAAIDLFGRLMESPDRARTILRGKLRDDDGSWVWSAIRETDWVSLVPGLYKEVGVFEMPTKPRPAPSGKYISKILFMSFVRGALHRGSCEQEASPFHELQAGAGTQAAEYFSQSPSVRSTGGRRYADFLCLSEPRSDLETYFFRNNLHPESEIL